MLWSCPTSARERGRRREFEPPTGGAPQRAMVPAERDCKVGGLSRYAADAPETTHSARRAPITHEVFDTRTSRGGGESHTQRCRHAVEPLGGSQAVPALTAPQPSRPPRTRRATADLLRGRARRSSMAGRSSLCPMALPRWVHAGVYTTPL